MRSSRNASGRRESGKKSACGYVARGARSSGRLRLATGDGAAVLPLPLAGVISEAQASSIIFLLPSVAGFAKCHVVRATV